MEVAELPRTSAPVEIASDGLSMSPKDKKPLVVATTQNEVVEAEVGDAPRRQMLRVKHNAMSNLSILLTVMSIMVAFR